MGAQFSVHRHRSHASHTRGLCGCVRIWACEARLLDQHPAANQPGTRSSTCDNALSIGDNALNFAALSLSMPHHQHEKGLYISLYMVTPVVVC